VISLNTHGTGVQENAGFLRQLYGRIFKRVLIVAQEGYLHLGVEQVCVIFRQPANKSLCHCVTVSLCHCSHCVFKRVLIVAQEGYLDLGLEQVRVIRKQPVTVSL